MSTNFSEKEFVEIRLNKHDILSVGLLNISHSNQNEDFDYSLRELISEAPGLGHSHILLMEDFNYPGINWEKWITIDDRTDTKEYNFFSVYRTIFLVKKRGFPVDRETLNVIRLKKILSRKAIITKDPEIRKQCNRTRNQVKKVTRRLRKEFENDISKKRNQTRNVCGSILNQSLRPGKA